MGDATSSHSSNELISNQSFLVLDTGSDIELSQQIRSGGPGLGKRNEYKLMQCMHDYWNSLISTTRQIHCSNSNQTEVTQTADINNGSVLLVPGRHQNNSQLCQRCNSPWGSSNYQRSHPGFRQQSGRRLVGQNQHHGHPSLRHLRQRDDRHHTEETSVRLVSHERLPDRPGPVRHRHAVLRSSAHVGTEGAGLRCLRQSRGHLQVGSVGNEPCIHIVGLAPCGSHRPASRLRRLAPPRQHHLHTSQKCRRQRHHHGRMRLASIAHVPRVRSGED